MIPTLETARLILRPLELSDAEQAQVLFPHWEVVRYIRNAVPWPYPQDGCYTYYRDVALPAVERGDEWAWTLRLKNAPDQLIGAISLFRSETDNRGFWLGLPWQRQGLMTEACDAVTDYWFEVLKFPVLRVPKAIANSGSRRISENQGMRVIARKTATTFLAACHRKFGRSPRKSGADGETHRYKPSLAPALVAHQRLFRPALAKPSLVPEPILPRPHPDPINN